MSALSDPICHRWCYCSSASIYTKAAMLAISPQAAVNCIPNRINYTAVRILYFEGSGVLTGTGVLAIRTMGFYNSTYHLRLVPR